MRGREFRGYRNGHAPERTVGVGVGAVSVRLPRVSDVPREVAPNGFESHIVGRYQRASEATQRLLARLYLEGLSTGTLSQCSGFCWGRRRLCRRAASRG